MSTSWKPAKVRAIGVIANGATPTPIITATFRRTHVKADPRALKREKVTVEHTYVLLEHDERWAIRRFATLLGEGWDLDPPGDGEGWASPCVPTHIFDAETGGPIMNDADGRDPIARTSSYGNAETLWVLASVRWVDMLRQALIECWQQSPREPEPGACMAPSWRTWTAIRKIFLASGAPDPAVPGGPMMTRAAEIWAHRHTHAKGQNTT